MRMTNNQDDWMSLALKREAEIERLRADTEPYTEAGEDFILSILIEAGEKGYEFTGKPIPMTAGLATKIAKALRRGQQ